MIPRLFNKGFIIILIFLINFSIVHAGDNETQEISVKKEYIDFTITGYYTPLENQDSYINGSFKEEVLMNGEGKHTASGKEVFLGLIAAPKKYPFGTKIFLEGYGVGIVEDRGGSLGNGENPRIDLWTGTGEIGMERARKIGLRKIKGYIVDEKTPININFGEEIIIKEENGEKLDIDNFYITPESNSKDIKKLQVIFSNILIYNGKIDGKYENIKDLLIKFQIDNGIIGDKKDSQAGYFGPKTIKKIKEKYKNIDNKEFLNEDEINFLQNKLEKLKKKFGSSYKEKSRLIKKQIEKIKIKAKIKEKTKIKLEYLESIIEF